MTHPQELGGGGVLGVGTTVVVPHEVGNGGGSRAMLIEKVRKPSARHDCTCNSRFAVEQVQCDRVVKVGHCSS